jgi:hypothetical protein
MMRTVSTIWKAFVALAWNELWSLHKEWKSESGYAVGKLKVSRSRLSCGFLFQYLALHGAFGSHDCAIK